MVGRYTFLFQQNPGWRVLVGFMLMSVNLCFSQENIRFERLSVNEGLSQADVKSMVQDKFGFLWIGTRDGLCRYDGHGFRRYNRRENDTTSLYFNQIFDLAEDASGNLWIGSAGGISIYDYQKDSFQNFSPEDIGLRDAEVNHILVTGEHTALLSTNKGLISFDRKKNIFVTDPDLELFKGKRVLKTCQNPEQGMWIATEKGVFIRRSVNSGWARLLADYSVHDIHFDPNGNVYLAASNGLFNYDPEQRSIEQVRLPKDIFFVNQVMRAKNGDLWVAANKVVVLGENDALKYVLVHDKFNNHSLSEDRARVLYQTRDEVIWIGTIGYGLNKFNPVVARFSYLSEQTSIPLSGNYISTIFTPDDTTLWIGTSHGLDVINLNTKAVKHFSSREELFQILNIFADRDNRIWITTSKGLMLYSGNKLIPKNTFLTSVYHLTEWDTTNLILASRVQGIYLFNRTTEKTSLFISATDLPEEVSCVLVEDEYLWVGCKDGLKLFTRDGKLVRRFIAETHSPGSLHSSFVKSVYRDSQKKLWVGTWGGGLSMLNADDSTFTTYNTGNGLPNNVVYGMLEDSAGMLWLSTNVGISAFNVREQTFRNFNFFDGLQSNEFNTGAYFQSEAGTLYFGGINGLNFFQPTQVLKNEPVPEILTTSIAVNNKPLTFQHTGGLENVLMIDKVKLRWSENNISVKFTAVDFKNGRGRSFQYSMKDTTWYDLGSNRSLELIDLPSGQHELKVRTSKPDGSWSAHEVLLMIDIVPPIWQRGWFMIMVGMIFLAMIFAASRYRVARLKSANYVLNKLVNDRTMEIQAMNEEIAAQNDQLHELNKELEAFSYSVSHDLRAPLRSVIGYSQMLEEDYFEKLDEGGKRSIRVIQQNAARMNHLIDDLLEFSKLNGKELQKSEIGTEKLVRNILDEMNTSQKVVIRLNPLPPIFADSKLFSQVWINLISNAIKYSSRKTNPIVEISSYKAGNEIIFYVKDNGAGFDMKYADKLFGVFQRLHKIDEFEGTGVGLALVYRIVTKHGGRVWAEGKVNEGATFYFSLPDQQANRS